MGSLVEYTVDAAVALVRLNRPPVNALSGELSADLKAAFEEAADPEIRAVVVTGQPHSQRGRIKAFSACRGGGSSDGPTLADTVASRRSREAPIGASRASLGEVGVVTEPTFVQAEDAQVAARDKVGVDPGSRGTQRLPGWLGPAAKEIVSRRQVGAEEALRRMAAGFSRPMTWRIPRAAAERPPGDQGHAAAKGPGRLGRPLEEGLDMEAAELDASFWTDDAREGVAAFLEKRAATFRGR